MPQEKKDKLEEAMKAAWGEAEGEEEAPEGEAPAEEDAPEEQAAPEAEAPEGGEQEQLGEEEAPEASTRPEPKPTAKAGKPGTPAAPAKGGKGPAAAPAAAPRAWMPGTREEWAKLPQKVKDQILKREGEFSRALQESGEARQGYAAVRQVLDPFLPHLRVAGVEPLRHVETLFRTDYALRMGTPAQKAAVVGDLIKSFNVDVDQLVAALEGKAPAQQAQPAAQPQQFRDPRLDQLLGQAQQAHRQQASKQLEDFAAKAEFLDEVRDDMADLMDASRKRGNALTLEQAYERACLLNEDVRTVLEQRKASQAQRGNAEKARNARNASSSVRSQPAPPAGSKKPSMDDALWAGLHGRKA